MAEINQKVVETLIKKLDKVAESIDKASVAEYIELFHNPWRLIYLNLLAGITRGFGIAVGFSAVGAVFLYLLGRLATWNLPVIGQFIADIARIVEAELRSIP